MKITDALSLARSLVNQHGFDDIHVTTSKTKNALGRCFFQFGKPVRIDLSSYWVNHLDEHEIRDTILHEIAHAIAGHKAGHGAQWKAVARQIGANPNRLADLPKDISEKFNEQHSNYVAICNNCDKHVYFNRLGKNWRHGVYRCAKCKGQFAVYNNK